MKFKKCGPEHEASYLFEVDKNWMRSGNDFSELLESIRKEAYLKDSGEARKKPVMDSGIRIAVKNSGKMKRQTKL